MLDTLGIYISVPFCRAKCTYCNFASGVFAAERMDRYVDRVCAEMSEARERARELRAELPAVVDTVYLGGGTPSLLPAALVERLFGTLRQEFDLNAQVEVTLECAPGQLSEESLAEFLRQGVNRVSFGVQSFVDREARAVGRLHTRDLCLSQLERMRRSGVQDINVDLIAGLPHQIRDTWRESVEVAVASEVPHVSLYMLEVDDESRLGREVLAEGPLYGAGEVPDDDEIADWYAEGCEWLNAAGVRQYEISNFARQGCESRHNMKYWRREPYLGFGLDAHSMLRRDHDAVRWANPDDLNRYEQGSSPLTSDLFQIASTRQLEFEVIDPDKAFEEALFLGLRMNRGVEVEALRREFGDSPVSAIKQALAEAQDAELIEFEGGWIRLSTRGRMASNEVFSRLLVAPV